PPARARERYLGEVGVIAQFDIAQPCVRRTGIHLPQLEFRDLAVTIGGLRLLDERSALHELLLLEGTGLLKLCSQERSSALHLALELPLEEFAPSPGLLDARGAPQLLGAAPSEDRNGGGDRGGVAVGDIRARPRTQPKIAVEIANREIERGYPPACGGLL